MFFLAGVAFAGVEAVLEAGLAVVLTGVGPVPVLIALDVLEAAGATFLAAGAPVVVAGFEALLTAALAGVFLIGVAVDFDGVAVVPVSVTAAGAFRTGSFFWVPSGVRTLAAGEAPVVAPAALSFLGTFLTGVAAVSAVLVAVLVAFFIGGTGVVFDAVTGAALAGVEVVIFFVAGVLLAVLDRLLTLARGEF